MATVVRTAQNIPWWKEPTKDQWFAFLAAWLGWMLDAFDFTVFLLIMVPIAKYFHVSLLDVTAVFAITLWMRLIGGVAAGWLADRIGRKTPLMVSIAWYSVCNLLAGLAPSFMVLFLFRALLGIGMGAEWPAGAALAMENWPARSRGIMSGVLQQSWPLGFLLSSGIYGLFYNSIGWRGLLIIGILPALSIIFIFFVVKESPISIENRRKQRELRHQFKAPLFELFKPKLLANTVTAWIWLGSAFVIYYTVYGLFATHLEKDLHYSPGLVALPIVLSNAVAFVCGPFWGWVSDRIGRRWGIIIPGAIGAVVTPFYLFPSSYAMAAAAFAIQGAFAGSIYGQQPSYLSERFPTEVRATAGGLCYQGAGFWGALTGPLLTAWAIGLPGGFAMPMLYATIGASVVLVVVLLFGPETKGKVLIAEPELVAAHAVEL